MLALISLLPVDRGLVLPAAGSPGDNFDHVTDVDAGKRTLVVRFGRRFGTHEYAALLASAYVVVVGAILGTLAPLEISNHGNWTFNWLATGVGSNCIRMHSRFTTPTENWYLP